MVLALAVPPAVAAYESALEEVDRLLLRLAVGERFDRAGLMATEHLGTGGKRVRARLALDACAAFGVSLEDAVPWAGAVEVLHNATLVHDDIQDGDHLRRGRPTVWARHGVPQAINTGDLLLMVPWLALRELTAPEAVRYRLAVALADRAQRTVRGQVDEMELLTSRRLDRVSYVRAALGKTGQLLALPVEGAALLAGCTPETARRVAGPFERLGLLFQLQDDLLDLFGDKGREVPGSDIREGRVTALVVAHLEWFPDDRDWLVQILDAPRDGTSDADVAEVTRRFRRGAFPDVLASIDEVTGTIADAPELVDHPVLQDLSARLVERILRPVAHLLGPV